MNEKLREMLDKINNKKLDVQNLVNAGKLDEAETAKTELVNMQREFNILKDVLDVPVPVDVAPVHPVSDDPKDDQEADFANAARMGFRVRNVMKEGTDPDGGYTVPKDIQTRINERREAKFSLVDLVDVEKVTTNKGSRVFKKRAQQTGFTKVGEGGKIGKKETPQFEIMDYEIAKYAGWFCVTNELLADSDANITGTIIDWIGDESRVTRNKIIIEAVKSAGATEITELDDIKKVLNVDLGAAFKNTSVIITNDDGLQWLDTLTDNNGRYLLTPVPNVAGDMQLAVGGSVIRVKVIGNEDLASNTETSGKRVIPFIIGDLKEGIKFFDRNNTTIKASDTAQAGELNAFEEDLTLFRAIEREDCKVKDDKAFKFCELTVDDKTVV